MTLTINENIRPIVDRRLNALQRRRQDLADTTEGLRLRFNALFGDRQLQSPRELIDLVEALPQLQEGQQWNEEVGQVVSATVDQIRIDVLLLAREYDEVQQRLGEVEASDVLPRREARRAGREERQQRQRELSEIAEDYLRMAGRFGSQTVATSLAAIGVIAGYEVRQFAGILSQMLGESRSTGGGGGSDHFEYDPDLLEVATIHDFMFEILKKHLYRELRNAQVDTMDRRGRVFGSMDRWW
jgi:hypothetical protein